MVDRFRVLTHVLRQESAFSLGMAGRKLRAAVEALQRFDNSARPRSAPERTRLVLNAAHALSACVIQREALGLRDHSLLTAEYGLTPEIWRSMGIIERPATRSGNAPGSD